jgi:AtzE family amidohydrolase
LIERLEAAGAILVGALNMSEYAYEFTGDNVHYGPSRNPHDPARMSGGSSGGSGSALAAGLVPLALGSDTSGSIRVPSSLCGIFGLKPTFGRLSRAGAFPLAGSFDHVGPMARTAGDLALAYDLMQGADPEDPVCTRRPAEPTLPDLDGRIGGVRVAVAGGYFARGLFPEARAAIQIIANALGADREVELPESDRARAAAFVITAGEAAQLHLERLRRRPRDFDPVIRDRLLAAAMLPVPFITKAQKFRHWYRNQVLDLFRDVDVIIAPATPCTAPMLGEETLVLDGEPVSVRRNLGLYTQPISFIGLPVVVVPVPLSPLPIGVQIITRPWDERLALRIARTLELMGVSAVSRPASAR